MEYKRLLIICSKALEDAITLFLSDFNIDKLSIEYKGDRAYISLFFPSKYNIDDIIHILRDRFSNDITLKTDVIKDTWSDRLHGDFRPLSIGDFYIVPEHLKGTVKKRDNTIYILPAQAFGTGQHETTHLMLEIISKDIDVIGKRVLDVGCGTGILGIAALYKGAKYIMGIDIDPLAIENAKKNFKLNNIHNKNITFSTTPLRDVVPYKWDIVFANIITSKLMGLRDEFKGISNGKTLFAFSGITIYQVDEFEECFSFLRFVKRYRMNDWVAVIGI